jgi:hypothetical protein
MRIEKFHGNTEFIITTNKTFLTMAAVPAFAAAEEADEDDLDEGPRSPVVSIHRARKVLVGHAGMSRHWKTTIQALFQSSQVGPCIDKKHCHHISTCSCLMDLALSEQEVVAAIHSFSTRNSYTESLPSGSPHGTPLHTTTRANNNQPRPLVSIRVG